MASSLPSNGSLSDGPSRTRRIRIRLIPVTLMAVFSGATTLICFWYAVMVIALEVNARWLHPNPELIADIQEKAMQPPLITAILLIGFATYGGFVAVAAWYRGAWLRAVTNTALFIGLNALASFVSHGRL